MAAGQYDAAPVDLGGRAGKRLIGCKTGALYQRLSAGRTRPCFLFRSHYSVAAATDLFHEETIADSHQR